MRHLVRIAIITFAMLAGYSSLPAQTVTVTGSKLQDSAGNLVNGTINWQPVTNTGSPTSYTAPGGGQVVSTAVKATVLNGAFSIVLPDVSLTNPPNICFSASLTTSKGSNLTAGYACVQPHGTATGSSDWCQAGVCNFDNYVPAIPTQVANYGPASMTDMWNGIVTAWLATSGNTVAQQTVTDASTINLNLNSASLSAVTLKLYSGTPAVPDGLTARTINVTGLVAGARFMLVIDPMDTSPATVMQTVTFGTGCVWQFSPGVAVPNNVLSIGPWMNSSYLAYFMYDGTNCIGIVTN